MYLCLGAGWFHVKHGRVQPGESLGIGTGIAIIIATTGESGGSRFAYGNHFGICYSNDNNNFISDIGKSQGGQYTNSGSYSFKFVAIYG